MRINERMEKGIRYGLICFLLISLFASGSSAVTLSIQNLTLSGPGSTGSSTLLLDSSPDGVAGYKINATMTTSGVARLTAVNFPSAFSGMNYSTPLPAEEVKVVAVDLPKSVEAGATNVTLCTFTIAGVTTGSTAVDLSIGELTDDDGDPIDATISNAVVTVGSVAPTPTSTPTPTATPTASPTATPTSTPTVTPTPGVADFSGSPRSGSAPLSVVFTPSVNGTVSGYIWSFGDGTSSDQTTPTHVYANGTYDVALLAQFVGGGSASVTKPGYITVTGTGPTPIPTCTVTPTPTPTPVPLVANFTADPVTGAPPLSVQFTDLSTGTPTKWKWNFGDGTFSTLKNPLHVYGGIGRYTVTLEVENRDLTAIARKIEFVKTSGPKR